MSVPNTPKMPDVTAAQILSIVTIAVGQVVAWGWIDNNRGQQIVSIGTFVVGIGWKAADAYIRAARNKRMSNSTVVTQEVKTP